jgi:hypothetical protein
MKTQSCIAIIVLLFLFVGCDSKDETEASCDQMVLLKAGSGSLVELYSYGSNGRMSKIAFSTGSIDFSYDLQGNLSETLFGSQVTKYQHDTNGRLIAILKFDDNTPRDSMAFEYDSEGRIAKRSIYTNQQVLTDYYLVKYPTADSVIVDFYSPLNGPEQQHSGTFIYTQDDKNRPYPEEYYEIYLSWTNVVLQHNQLSLVDTPGTAPHISTLQYNERGYLINDTGKVYTYGCLSTQ